MNEVLNNPAVRLGYNVVPSERTIKLLELIVKYNKCRDGSVYVYNDSRGQVICDNFDNPFGIALITTDDGYVIHACGDGHAKLCNEEDAKKGAVNFFNSMLGYVAYDYCEGERLY